MLGRLYRCRWRPMTKAVCKLFDADDAIARPGLMGVIDGAIRRRPSRSLLSTTPRRMNARMAELEEGQAGALAQFDVKLNSSKSIVV